MKNNSGNQSPKHQWDTEQEMDDPVWNILDKASRREPSVFFARNVVRATRQLDIDAEPASGSWVNRLGTAFSSRKLALATAACLCAIVAYQMWLTAQSPGSNIGTTTEPSNDLSELVIEETLSTAAEDPTIFTRDELVAMIGF